jgi:anti-sigma B factor antagonist
MPSSSVASREIGRVTIVDLKGPLMLGESSALLRATLQELMAKHRTQIILNFRAVTEIDSAGIAVLVGGYTTVRAKGGKIKFLSPPPKLEDMFRLTQLAKVFEIYEEEAAALKSFD